MLVFDLVLLLDLDVATSVKRCDGEDSFENEEFLNISKARREEINNISKRDMYLKKLQVQSTLFEETELDLIKDPHIYYERDLPF